MLSFSGGDKKEPEPSAQNVPKNNKKGGFGIIGKRSIQQQPPPASRLKGCDFLKACGGIWMRYVTTEGRNYCEITALLSVCCKNGAASTNELLKTSFWKFFIEVPIHLVALAIYGFFSSKTLGGDSMVTFYAIIGCIFSMMTLYLAICVCELDSFYAYGIWMLCQCLWFFYAFGNWVVWLRFLGDGGVAATYGLVFFVLYLPILWECFAMSYYSIQIFRLRLATEGQLHGKKLQNQDKKKTAVYRLFLK